jgi:hypothetical protein
MNIKQLIERIVDRKLNEGVVSDIKRRAREYPGSYQLGITGRTKINGVTVTYISYTNPNNITSRAYVNYSYKNTEDSMNIDVADMYNKTKIEAKLESEM